ncbi:MAG: hypothetical protein Q9157_000651 [Trypethelium eluteriae]
MPRKRAPKTTHVPASTPRPYVYEHTEDPSPSVQPPSPSAQPPSTTTNSSNTSLCASLPSFSAALSEHLRGSDLAFIPELCVYTFRFEPSASFLVDLSSLPSLAQTLPKKANSVGSSGATLNGSEQRKGEREKELYLVTVAGTLNLADTEADRLAKQKAVARAIVDTVQETDGYMYARTHQRVLKEEQGVHMTFNCSDSQQNKDRVANKKRSKAGDANQEQDEGREGGILEGENGENVEKNNKKTSKRLPTYDCKGAVTVRFSSKSKVLEVVYRHLMVHRETAWQTRQPRKRASKEEAELRREEKRKAKEKERRAGVSRLSPTIGKRKRGPLSAEGQKNMEANEQGLGAGEVNGGTDSQSPERWKLASGSMDESNLDTLAELLRADIDNMNQEAAAVAAAIAASEDTRIAGETAKTMGQKKKTVRTKGNCLTCRKRKVKCDQTKPRCATCTVKNRECTWSDHAQANAESDPRPADKTIETIEAMPKILGCLNCREGKVKCDRERPSCLACRLKKRECIYSETEESSTRPPTLSSDHSVSWAKPTQSQHTPVLEMNSPMSLPQGTPVSGNGLSSQETSGGGAVSTTAVTPARAVLHGTKPSQSEGSMASDKKPRKKRRKKSPPLRLAFSPSPPPHERACEPAVGHHRSLSDRHSKHEEDIVFEAEDP